MPGAAPGNKNAPTTAKWVAEHAFLWDRIPGGYRMQVQEMSTSGQPTGKGQPVQIFDPKGNKRYLDVLDRDATAVSP